MPTPSVRSSVVPAVHHLDLLIGGRRVDRAERIEVRNPAHPSQLVGTVVRGDGALVDLAVAAAREAQPGWAALGYRERAAILSRCLDALEQSIDERAELFVRENGKTLREARTDLAGVSARQRLTLELVGEIERDRLLDGPRGRTIVTHAPYGVVVSIVPWNGPVGLAFLQIVPALLTGNTVVVKPPESCPLTLLRSIDLIAGLLPAGVLNAVTGLPEEIGERLTTHPAVDKIAFTGSIRSGAAIMAAAAATIKSVTLELGGNDAAILLDDADLGDDSLQRMVDCVFRMAGQVCMAIKRIYVPSRLVEPFLERFTALADRIVVGDGLRPDVTMGPLHSERGRRRALEMLDDVRARGAAVAEVGAVDAAATFDEGWFMRPTVVSGLADDAPLVAEEQFAPAIPVLAYDDVDDAVRRANGTAYGLGGSVWGRDVDRALEVARRLEAGTIWVNTHGTWAIDRRAPYGGIKQSGIGRRAGREGVEEYLQLKTLTALE